MTPLQQTCGEMLLAQDGLQQVSHEQRAINTGRLQSTPEDRADVYLQQGFCSLVLAAASARLTRFAAANDNTMVVGAA